MKTASQNREKHARLYLHVLDFNPFQLMCWLFNLLHWLILTFEVAAHCLSISRHLLESTVNLRSPWVASYMAWAELVRSVVNLSYPFPLQWQDALSKIHAKMLSILRDLSNNINPHKSISHNSGANGCDRFFLTSACTWPQSSSSCRMWTKKPRWHFHRAHDSQRSRDSWQGSDKHIKWIWMDITYYIYIF